MVLFLFFIDTALQTGLQAVTKENKLMIKYEHVTKAIEGQETGPRHWYHYVGHTIT